MPPVTRAATVRRRGQQSNEVIKRPYRTITDLPPELLHMIFSYLRPWTRHLKACSLTCRALRDVSVEYLKFPHPSVRDLPRFVEFMQSHPPILTTIRGICLGSGTRLDATLVNTIKTLFPKLDYLNLVNISFDPTLDQTQSAALPFQLNRLNLTCMPPMQGPRCSLPGMMHIISLLAPQKLSLQIDEGFRFDGRQSFGPSCIAASPAIASLRVRFGRPVEIDVATVLDALTKTLAPDTLQTVDVYYDSKATVRALGTMLARIGSSVTTLTLHASILSSNPYKVEKWSDPFDDWKLLDLRACPKLESFDIPMFVPPNLDKPKKHLSFVSAGLLANYAPPTLRKVYVTIHNLTRPTTLGNRVVLRLQEFDKAVTQARFPLLQRFRLRVEVTRQGQKKFGASEKCRAAAVRALPGLHARGVLRVDITYL